MYQYKLMEYCYVFDFINNHIYEITLSEEELELSTEDLLKKHNLDFDACQVMWSENKLEIETI